MWEPSANRLCFLSSVTLDGSKGKKTLLFAFNLSASGFFCLIFLPPCHAPLPSPWDRKFCQYQLRSLVFVREAELALWTDLHAEVRLKGKYSMYTSSGKHSPFYQPTSSESTSALSVGRGRGRVRNISRTTKLKLTAVVLQGWLQPICRHMQF